MAHDGKANQGSRIALSNHLVFNINIYILFLVFITVKSVLYVGSLCSDSIQGESVRGSYSLLTETAFLQVTVDHSTLGIISVVIICL